MTELILSFLAFVLLGALFRTAFSFSSRIFKTSRFPAMVFFIDALTTFLVGATYFLLLVAFFNGQFVYESALGFLLGFFAVYLFF